MNNEKVEFLKPDTCPVCGEHREKDKEYCCDKCQRFGDSEGHYGETDKISFLVKRVWTEDRICFHCGKKIPIMGLYLNLFQLGICLCYQCNEIRKDLMLQEQMDLERECEVGISDNY